MEHLRIALSLFEECIYGLLMEWDLLSRDNRMMQFIKRSQWHKALRIDINAFL